MPENTFDIVSKIDLQEVTNAIQQAMKEVTTRFDLKDTKSRIELEGKDAILMHSSDEFKLKAVRDVLDALLQADRRAGTSLRVPNVPTITPRVETTNTPLPPTATQGTPTLAPAARQGPGRDCRSWECP